MTKKILFVFAIFLLLCSCTAEQLTADGGTKEPQIEVKAKVQLVFARDTTKKEGTRAVNGFNTPYYFETNGHYLYDNMYFSRNPLKGDLLICFYNAKTKKLYKRLFKNEELNTGKVTNNSESGNIKLPEIEGSPAPHYSGYDYVGEMKYSKYGETINQDLTFLTSSTEDITKGEWYAICFYSTTMDLNQLSVNAPYGILRYNRLEKPWSQPLTVPFASLWRRLDVIRTPNNQLVFYSKTPIAMRMLGTVITLNIANKTDSYTYYHHMTMISSGDTRGYFDINKVTELSTNYIAESSYNPDENSDEGYQKIIDLMWTGTNKRETESQLSYTHYKIKYNDEGYFNKLESVLDYGESDKVSENLFWFISKESNRGEIDKAELPNINRYKTQFLLHGTSIGGRRGRYHFYAVPKDASIFASIPVYGTKKKLKNCTRYRCGGTLYYEPGPLNYMAKENFTANGTFSNSYADAKNFSLDDMANIKIPEGYHIPTRMEWQTIFPRYANMQANEPLVSVTPAEMGKQKVRFAQYVANNNNDNKTYTHIVTQRKMPTSHTMGKLEDNNFLYNWYAEKATAYPYQKNGATDGESYTNNAYGTEANLGQYSLLPDNKYQYAIRIDYENMQSGAENARMVLTQRYLGPNFILDPFDIDTDEYWKYTGYDDVERGDNWPKEWNESRYGKVIRPLQDEVQRVLPLYGYALNANYNPQDIKNTATNFPFGAIYWSNTEANTEKMITTPSSKPRLPLYFNFNNKVDWWRTDNTGTNKNFYNNGVPQFSGMIRLFYNTPKAYE